MTSKPGQENQLCRAATAGIIAVAIGTLVGCSEGYPPSEGAVEPGRVTAAASTPVAIPGDDPGPSEIVIKWQSTPTGTVRNKTESLTAELTNATQLPQSTKVTVTATGLDGRLVHRSLGEVQLGPRETRTLPVTVGQLPMQSETSPTAVSLQVDLSRPEGTVHGTTEPIYLVFRNDYSEAVLYRQEEIAFARQKGAQLATNLMDVRGRIMDGRGQFVEVATAGNISGPGWKQGLTAIEASSSAELGLPSTSSSASARSVSALAAAVQICTHWRVQYIDTGLGEDYLNSSAWTMMNVPASFARFWVKQGSTVVYSGNLNLNGCTAGLLLDPGNYTLQQATNDQRWGSFEFDNDYDVGTSTVSTILSTGFTVTSTPSSPITLYPTGLGIDVQTAAVTGWLLNRQAVLQNGMGLPTSGNVTVHANRACPGGVGSCTTGSTVYISPNNIVGYPRRYWKYNISHELGHAVMGLASGTPWYHYDWGDDPNMQKCRCDHVDGEQRHCLQSREESNAAQHEGIVHAFATRLFNNHQQQNGWFIYYKEFMPVFGAEQFPPTARDAYNPVAAIGWMESQCTANQYGGKGVEFDWLTFFYKIGAELPAPNNTSHTTPNALFSIYRRACNSVTPNWCDTGVPDTLPPTGDDVQWAELLAGAATEFSSDGRFTRFSSTGGLHGVDH